MLQCLTQPPIIHPTSPQINNNSFFYKISKCIFCKIVQSNQVTKLFFIKNQNFWNRSLAAAFPLQRLFLTNKTVAIKIALYSFFL
jgi:hypothetical protein